MIVIIDNYDSFTYNLVHYLERLDSEVKVFQNNQITASHLLEENPDLIVLSPGPGRPSEAGVSKEILSRMSSDIPIVGVCLGHQTIIEHFGGKIVKADQPMHGKLSVITHNKKGLFAGIANPTQITRYHSLIADEAYLPDCLEVTARAECHSIMGVAHRELPVTGIQFHPESITTTEGFQMLENCYQQAKRWKVQKQGGHLDEVSIPVL